MHWPRLFTSITPCLVLGKPNTPKKREIVGSWGLGVKSKNGSLFREFLDGNNMCAIITIVGVGSKTWRGMALVEQFQMTLFVPGPYCRAVSGP